jgi:hypothetical protein
MSISTITSAYRKQMTDNQYRVLLYYKNNDKKGNGIMGRPLSVNLSDLKTCIVRNWISDRPVGVASIYKITESGLKVIKEREDYMKDKCIFMAG